MIINSITLHNFKSHKHSHINFDRGISCILGNNGAGKSSIFEAISFSLFKNVNGTLDEIIRKPVDEKDIVDKMEVTVEFEVDGNYYKVIRGKGSKSFAKLYTKDHHNYEIYTDRINEVNDVIEKIIGLDSKSFSTATYIKQGEITEFIDKSGAEKKEFIGKLLNINDVQKAWEEIKNVIKIYEDKKTENKGKLTIKDNIEQKINDVEKDIKSNLSKLSEQTSKEESLKKELEVLFNKIEESDNKKIEYTNLKNQFDQQQKLIDTLQSQKNEIDENLNKISKFEKECESLDKYVKILPKYKKLKEYESELKNLKIRLENVTTDIETFNENKQIMIETEEAYSKYNSIDLELKELSEKRKKMEEKVLENQKIIFNKEEKEKRKQELFNEINNTSERASNVFNENFRNPEEVENKVIDEKTKITEEIDSLNKIINENKDSISRKDNELKNRKKSLEELENTRDTCPICQSPISHEKHEELSNKYNDDIINLEKEIADFKQNNENQKNNVKKLENNLKEIETINIDRLKEQYGEFIEILHDIEELNKFNPQIENDDKTLKELDVTIEEKKNYQKELKPEFNKYLVATENTKNVEIETKISTKQDLTSNIQKLKRICNDIVAKYGIEDDLDRTIKYVEEKVTTYNKYQAFIEQKDSFIEKNKEITDKKSEEEKTYQNIKENFNNLNYDDEENKMLHKTYTSQQSDYEKISNSITELNVEIKKDKETLKDNKNELNHLNEISTEQDNLTDYIKLLENIREIYSKEGIQKTLINKARPDIERNTMEIFNDFDFDYSALRIDENYDIQVENNNEVLDLKMMSGGEKIAVALSLRLGIARVITQRNTEVLLLDEPTIHLDAEKRDRLIEIIGNNTSIPQMIVVTHDEGMEALSNHVIKINKENGISYVDNS